MESDGLGLRKMGWRWWEVGKRYGSVAGAEGAGGEVTPNKTVSIKLESGKRKPKPKPIFEFP